LNLYELEERLNNSAEAKKQLDLAATQLNQLQVPTSARPEFLRMRAVVEVQSEIWKRG